MTVFTLGKLDLSKVLRKCWNLWLASEDRSLILLESDINARFTGSMSLCYWVQLHVPWQLPIVTAYLRVWTSGGRAVDMSYTSSCYCSCRLNKCSIFLLSKHYAINDTIKAFNIDISIHAVSVTTILLRKVSIMYLRCHCSLRNCYLLSQLEPRFFWSKVCSILWYLLLSQTSVCLSYCKKCDFWKVLHGSNFSLLAI